jgi:lambda repressor-like predicted transcriptional regulator
VGTVMPDVQRVNGPRQQHWHRLERAERFEQYQQLQAQGVSQRQAAKTLKVPRTTLQAWLAYQERLDDHPAVVTFFQSPPGLAFLHRLVVALHQVCCEVGACGIRLVCLLLRLSGLDRFVGASYGSQQHVNQQVEDAIVAFSREENTRLAKDMPCKTISVAQDETFTGGLCLVAIDLESNYIILEQTAQGRDQDTWKSLMDKALAGLNCRVLQSTSDEAPGLLAYVANHLDAHHSPDLFHMQHELVKAVSGPLATKQRAAIKTVAALEAQEKPACSDVPMARQELERISAQREQVAQSIHRISQVYHVVDLERGVRRHAQLIAADIHEQVDTIRQVALQAGLSQSCLERIDKAERVVPKMEATIAFVSRYVRQEIDRLELPPPQALAMPARLMPASYLERVAKQQTVRAGEPLRQLAERLRAPLFEPGGALANLEPVRQQELHHQAQRLAAVFQRSSSNVEGRNGCLSLRNHQLRGLDRPRKRACLTAIHNFFLTRADGTTAAERFFGQKPRSMFAAVLGAVEIPPAPLSPPRPVAV